MFVSGGVACVCVCLGGAVVCVVLARRGFLLISKRGVCCGLVYVFFFLFRGVVWVLIWCVVCVLGEVCVNGR